VVSALYHLRLITDQQLRFVTVAREASIRWADAVVRIPIGSGTADVVYASHVLEHLDRGEVLRFLSEIARVLAPGGIVRLAVPDLARLVSRYVKTQDADELISATLLAQPRPRGLVPVLRQLWTGGRHHLWMYDGLSLVKLLETAGFMAPRALAGGETTIPDSGPLDLREREEESVYVEALRPNVEVVRGAG
jgi:SAM-dependent methyltransferase